jgi:hypothetical protein
VSLWQGGERFENTLSIFLMDTDSVVQYLNVQLTLSGIKMAAYPDFSVVVRVLKRIINQITDDLLDTQLILGQFLWNII